MHLLGMSRVQNQLLVCLQMLVLLPGFQLYLVLYVSALTSLYISIIGLVNCCTLLFLMLFLFSWIP